MIDEGIDPGRFRSELARRGRVQVPSYLQPDAAERLNLCLREEVPWTLAWRGRGEPGVLSHEELEAKDEAAYQALLRALAAEAHGTYAFAYESYMMVRAYNEGRDPGLLLHRVLETFLPRWNSLSLFKVPADHLVTPVAPWAEQDRLSITGWFQA